MIGLPDLQAVPDKKHGSCHSSSAHLVTFSVCPDTSSANAPSNLSICPISPDGMPIVYYLHELESNIVDTTSI